MYVPGFQHGETFAHDGHAPFVKVTERPRGRFAGKPPADQLSGVVPLLNRHLRHAWQRPSVLIQGRGIANDKYFGMPSEAKIILDAHASGVIRFRRQPFAGRRRRDTGGPDDGLAEDPFSRHDNAISIDSIHALPEFHLDP